MRIPFVAWLTQGIPECIAVVAFIMSFDTIKLPWLKIFLIGLLQGIIAYLVRLLPITPGVHTIILILTTSAFCTAIGKMELRKALVYSNIATLIIVSCEFIVELSGGNVISTFQPMASRSFQSIMQGELQVIILAALVYVVNKRARSGKEVEFFFRHDNVK